MKADGAFKKRSIKERVAMTLSIYKHLLNSNKIAFGGAAHLRFEELLKPFLMRYHTCEVQDLRNTKTK